MQFDRDDRVPLVLFASALAIVLFIRARTLDVALERDEGEYAYIAQLMLDGVPPYTRAYTMKYPGMPALYSLAFLLVGESTQTIHGLLALFAMANVVLLYLLVRRFSDTWTSAIAGSIYAFWSLMPELCGLWAQCEHFAVTFCLAGYLLAVRAVPAQCPSRAAIRFITAGAFLGLGVVMKQHAALFAMAAAVYCAVAVRPLRAAAVIVAYLLFGVAFIVGGMFATLLALGVIEPFWFWTFTYAREYAAGTLARPDDALTIASILWLVTSRFGAGSYLLDCLMLVGLASLTWDADSRRGAGLWLLMLAGGFLAALPGLRFAAHHFLFMLPAAAVLAAHGVLALVRLSARDVAPARNGAICALAATGTLAAVLWGHRAPWFIHDMQTLAWMNYGHHCTSQLARVGEHLSTEVPPGSTIAILGSEPQLYFYADRRSATKFIYMYPFTEYHPYTASMAREMLEELDRAEPDFVVLVNNRLSWGVVEMPPGGAAWSVWRWINARTGSYEKVGMVNVYSMSETRYKWGAQASREPIQSPVWVAVFRRRQ